MKYSGCTSEHKDERAQDLLRAYHEYLRTHAHIDVEEAFRAIVKMPSRRFWVSKIRAAIVISEMMHGDDLRGMRPSKRAMFEEIFRRVRQLMGEERWQGVPLRQVVSYVIDQPAPQFYLSPDTARLYIKPAKKAWHKKHILRWRPSR